jgi:archaellum component FlaC
MAETWTHKQDTGKAVGTTTSPENIELLKDVVHLAIDGQLSLPKVPENRERRIEECKEELNGLFSRLMKLGITIDAIYNKFIKNRVSKNTLETEYNGDKLRFLLFWLLHPYSPNHQMYTHKGADYDYSKEPDKDYWSSKEIHQSWLVKRYLLIKAVQEIYSVSPGDAEKMGITLYSIHRLRDLQYNGSDTTPPERKAYLFNVVEDLEKYTLPLIKDASLYNKIKEQIENIKKGIETLRASGNWDGILKAADMLLGPVDSDEPGLIDEMIPLFTSK